MILLKFFLDELQGLARSPAECIRFFHAKALEKTTFLQAVSAGEPPHTAYHAAKSALCLPHGMENVLDAAFENFGRGGRREECRRLSEAVARAETLLAQERQAYNRRLKLCRTLATASAMGLVILLM